MTKTTYTKEFEVKAFLQLGGEQMVLSGDLKGNKTELQVEFESLSLEKIINNLIQLVRPTYSLQLPFPWNKILGFELKNLVLSYNIQTKSIGFACDFSFSVPPLLELKRVYIDAKSVHEVMIAFEGKVFNELYEGNNKLGWNLVGADGPPTPPPPPSLLELKFLGLGQHVRLTKAAQYEHVSDAITDMVSLFEPPEPGTLIPSFSKALAFDNDSNWLFGLDAEIMGTVALSIVFNDPNLYGLFISLKGEKAKALAGLEFEILYKKITDDIGVYQIELKLPAYIRNMEFGAVSVTLPQIGIDIYTNGNFKIDFGFPRNLNFTNSFAVQVFPFVGFGGFYFAVLNGATSSTVPVSQNGNFNPVLEFGIGLQLGIGKTIDKGILQASATLTYVGVVEGTLAWFNATPALVDKSLPDFYYRLNGTFAIVGKIWGGVHFAIVSASLDLTVYASATVVIEACEPILLSFTAGVSVSLKVSVDLGLFTIHVRLSFHATISYQFLIGSPSDAQWKQQQRVFSHSPDSRSTNTTPILAPLTEQEKDVSIELDWNGSFPENQAQTIDLYYFTQFSATGDASKQRTVALGMLFAPIGDNTARNETLTSLDGIHNELLSFEQIAISSLCWAINAATHKDDQATSLDDLLAKSVTSVKLANLLFTINHNNQPAPFSYQQIVSLLKSLFIFNIKDEPDNLKKEAKKDSSDKKLALNLSLFPMIPDLYFTPQDQDEISFKSTHPVGDHYLEKVRKLVNRFVISQQEHGKRATQSESESLATLLFCDYFQLLIKTLVQSALDAMQVYKFTIPATMGENKEPPTLYRITRLFTTDDVSSDDISAIAVSNANNTALLNPGGKIKISGIHYSIEKDNTLAGILDKYGLLASGQEAGDNLVEELIQLNGEKEIFISGQAITYAGSQHLLGEGETLVSLIKTLKLEQLQRAELFNSIIDQPDILQVFKQISIPTIEHTIKGKESLLDITNRYQVDINSLAVENQDNETILQVSTIIIIENVRKLNIGELIAYLLHDGALGHAAGTASRFFMYGLRLPRDLTLSSAGMSAAEPFDALYSLTGQQFDFNLEQEKETSELTFNSVKLSKTPQQEDDDKEQNPTDPLPWVAFNGHAVDPDTNAPAKLVHQFLDNEIKIATNYQLASFSPTIEHGPLPIKLYNDQLKTFTFSNPISWQRETATENTQVPTSPSIWQFPPSLRSARDQSPSLQMVVGTQAQKSAAIHKNVIEKDKCTWSTLLPVSIRKVQQGSGKNNINANTYEVYGTDAAGIELLTELVELVNLTTIVQNTQILFPSSPDKNEANALQSYGESGLTLFINTNLSTETNPDTLITSAEEKDSSISSTSSQEMIIRLWKASLVRTGGYYLFLRNRDGAGLPEGLFKSAETAEIYLLISYIKQEQISTFMNSVIIERFIDTQQSVLFAEWTVPVDKDDKFSNPDQLVKDNKIARIPAILPGNVGFKIVRENPNKKFNINNPDERFKFQLETQYNLVDFQVVENDNFTDIGEGLPVGPEKDHSPENFSKPTTNEVRPTDLTDPWKYRRVFPLSKIIKNLPKYKTSYLGLNKTVNMRFGWRDSYGNQLQQSQQSLGDLQFTIKYFDYLIALSQWPHLDVNYEFLATEPDGNNFQINFLFHPANEYTISSTTTQPEDVSAEIKTLKDKVQADLTLYEKALDQLRQDDVNLFYTVSMTPDVEYGSPQANNHTVLKDGVINYLTKIIRHLIKYIEDLEQFKKQAQIPEIENIAFNWNEHIGNENTNDIFSLEVVFNLTRLPELVDQAFENVAQVKSVKTVIKPKSESPPILTVENEEEISTYVAQLDNNQLPDEVKKVLDAHSVEISTIAKNKEWKIKTEKRTYTASVKGKTLTFHSTSLGLGHLAETFEHLYPGMKVSSAYTKGKQQQEVWIVRFKTEFTNENSKNNSKGIGFTIHNDQALFYAPQPLSTHLVTLEQVPLYSPTEYGVLPPPPQPTRKTFSMIDPETWAIDYLETLEITLRPEFSIPITMFDTLNKKADKGFLYSILQTKQKVAYAIAFQTIPILQDHTMQNEGLRVAREKIKQQLLINLLDGYRTNAVVQYNVDVVSSFPNKDNPIAPNLFGQPSVLQKPHSPDEEKDTDHAPNYSISTAKVALEDKNRNNLTPGNSYLTFLFNTQTERDRSTISLNIDYNINQLEFDIRKLDDKVDQSDPEDIKNYSISKWLSFVKPFANAISQTSTQPVTTHFPIPLRQYPQLPIYNTQQFTSQTHRDKNLSIKEAKQIDYHFSYTLPQFTAQDTMHFEVLFNSQQADEGQLLRLSKPTDALDRALHQKLAQFSEAKDPILQNLRILLPQVKVDMDENLKKELTNLLASYDSLASQVAEKWYHRFDPDQVHKMGEASLKVITAKFDLDEGQDSKKKSGDLDLFRITMTNWSVSSDNGPIDFIGVPTVLVDGYQAEIYGYEKASGDEQQLITSDNRYRPWERVIFYYFKLNTDNEKVFLTFIDGVKLLSRIIQFHQLDVLMVQNGWAGLNVVRNAKLSSDKETSEEFVYTTPMKRFANPVTPMLDVSNELDIASLHEGKSSELLNYMSTLMKNLLELGNSGQNSSAEQFQPTTIKILTSYNFTPNPQAGAIISQPCFLIPPTKFDKEDAAGNGAGITLLTQGIIEWFSKNYPVQTEGKLFFDITFYSLLADNDLPVLRLRHLFINVEKITTLTKYAG